MPSRLSIRSTLKRPTWFLALAAIPLVLVSVWQPSSPGLSWWTTNALDKVRPDDPEPDQPTQAVQIHAARNEFEPFQIVLHAGTLDVEGIDIDVTDLQNQAGARIDRDNVCIYFEPYINLKMPSSIDGASGEWPDALIPRIDRYKHEKRNAFPFTLRAGRNQPVWLDVYVPASAAPGLYHGEVQVSAAGRLAFRIPVELDVWSFVLPSTSSLATSFGFNGMGAMHQHFGKYTNDRQLYEISFLYEKAALWHRISMHGRSGIPPATTVSGEKLQVNWTDFDNELRPFMEGKVFSSGEALYGARATSAGVRTPPALKTSEQQIQFWRQAAEHFRKTGWMDRMFNYLWDEPRPDEFESLVQAGELVHRADPQVKNLVTAPFHPAWAGAVDIWTPVINCFEQKNSRHEYCEMTVGRSAYDPVIANGKQLWWYQACASHGCNIIGGEYFRGWPSYMIDHRGVRNRIMEWLTWKYRINGELYFNTDEAFSQRDPWKDVRLFGGNGDGTLFYPGRPEIIGGISPVPIESIRLKLIREGLEDYEYLVMLERSRGRAAVEPRVNAFIRNTYDFDQDPKKLYEVRNWMGEQLSK